MKVTYFIVDHRLRKNSSLEALSVKNRLKKYNINASILKWSGAKPTSNIQSLARSKRYSLLIKQAKKSQSKIGLKEIRLRMRISQHDIESKKKQIISFLEEGNKVKISLLMRGRENAYPDLGVEILKKINDDLENVSEIDKPPSLEGRTLSIIIAPK